MIKYALFVFSSLLGANAAAVLNCSTTLTARPVLYRLEKGDLSFLLLATKNVDVELTRYPDVVREVLDTADRVTFELTKPPGFKFALRSVFAMAREFEFLLSKALTREEFQRLLVVTGHTPRELDRLSPYGANLAFLMKSARIDIKTAPMKLDGQILHYLRRSRRVPTEGLEPVNAHLETLTKVLDLNRLRAELNGDLPPLGDERSAFLRGDEAALAAEVDQAPFRSSESWITLLPGRQEAWITKITEASRQARRHLVVLGANHLYGENGLLEKFKRLGFTVTRAAD